MMRSTRVANLILVEDDFFDFLPPKWCRFVPVDMTSSSSVKKVKNAFSSFVVRRTRRTRRTRGGGGGGGSRVAREKRLLFPKERKSKIFCWAFWGRPHKRKACGITRPRDTKRKKARPAANDTPPPSADVVHSSLLLGSNLHARAFTTHTPS